MNHYHAVVWVDHREAHVIAFNQDEAEAALVHSGAGSRHVHQRAGSVSGARAGEDADFFRRIGAAVRDCGEVLLTGPAAAKLHLYDWWKRHEPTVAAKVVGVESADHPSDGALLKHARAYFEATDRMRPQA
ncbi:hypothetical protein BURK1_01408 [Burkholderiales bacterium]|nr:hypothetical protein BURK1_01408 [Burkholderiales bacterium]